MKTLIATFFLAGFIQPTFNVDKKTYILIHGAWHGAWCWKKVVPLLEAKGNRVLAIDLPGHGDDKTPVADITLDDYVKKIVTISNSQTGPVILVGHSMAGVLISAAAETLGKEKVQALIYLDAFMPQNNESVFSMVEKVKAKNNPQEGPSVIESLILSEDKKASKLKMENVRLLFYHDCSSEDVAFAQQNLGWQSMICLGTPVTVTESRFGVIPKFYILCTLAKDLDKTALSKNIPCQKVYTLESSHSPFFSMPEKLTEILNGI